MKLDRLKLIHSINVGGKESAYFTKEAHDLDWSDTSELITVTNLASQASMCTMKHNVISVSFFIEPVTISDSELWSTSRGVLAAPAFKPGLTIAIPAIKTAKSKKK